MEIRKVRESDDFESIGNIYARSWQAAYRGIVPQDYLESLSGARWSSVLSTSRYDAYVIIEDNRYIGTSSVCPARDEELRGWGEIISIYLLPEYFGKGYAKPLLKTAMDDLLSKGFQDIYLWVLDENRRAQKFYTKNNFVKSSDRKQIEIGGKELTEIRYNYHAVP